MDSKHNIWLRAGHRYATRRSATRSCSAPYTRGGRPKPVRAASDTSPPRQPDGNALLIEGNPREPEVPVREVAQPPPVSLTACSETLV
jgi:hypothetical protein